MKNNICFTLIAFLFLICASVANAQNELETTRKILAGESSKQWIITRQTQIGSDGIQRDLPFKDCEKDNIVTFARDGSYKKSEGAVWCEPRPSGISDDGTYDSGSWTLTNSKELNIEWKFLPSQASFKARGIKISQLGETSLETEYRDGGVRTVLYYVRADKVPKNIAHNFPWKKVFETTEVQDSDTWSEMTISKNGRVDYHISIKNRDRYSGACIKFYLVFADSDGNIIKTTGTTQFCVDGRLPVRSRSEREDFFSPMLELTPNELAELGKVEVIFSPGGKPDFLGQLKGNLEKVREVVNSCPECKAAIIAAF